MPAKAAIASTCARVAGCAPRWPSAGRASAEGTGRRQLVRSPSNRGTSNTAIAWSLPDEAGEARVQRAGTVALEPFVPPGQAGVLRAVDRADVGELAGAGRRRDAVDVLSVATSSSARTATVPVGAASGRR